MRSLFGLCLTALFGFCSFCTTATAGDWPVWRYDVRHTGISPHPLPEQLQLQWTLTLPPLTPAWLDQPMMPFDAGYEPIIVGEMMYVGSSRTDSVTAYDTRSGRLRWRFLADGPVRFAPIHHRDNLYFVSDDGHLYCLNAADGSLKWKKRGGPSEKRLIGNGRLISMWPARGAPVVADGTVYFAASIWPFMGIFIHALDAETGEVRWTNDGDGSLYIKQPHSADSFAGVAPQGPMAIEGDLLFVPGGRSVPAVYNRQTGKLVHFLLNDNSKKGGGHAVTLAGTVFYNGTGAFLTKTGKSLGDVSPVLIADESGALQVKAGELQRIVPEEIDVVKEPKEGEKPKPPEKKWILTPSNVKKVGHATVLIQAGQRAYLGLPNKVIAIDLKGGDAVWEHAIEGTPVSLVAADDRLFVVTREGRISSFGKGEAATADQIAPSVAVSLQTATLPKLRDVLRHTQARDGIAVLWSADPEMIADLIARTSMFVIAFDADPARVRATREAMNDLNLSGTRCQIHHGTPATAKLPPYLATLMIADTLDGDALKIAYESLRPYGGTLYLNTSLEQQQRLMIAAERLPKAVFRGSGKLAWLTRSGSLPGAADWTHEHADAANTRVSKDSVVKAPLGVLWFGGTTNEGILPRHGHGPQPQVIDGRIIIEGVDMLRAVDLYTGRPLWEAKLPGLGEFYNNTLHQPGANARGTNYISLSDGIYVAYRLSCLRIDPATGRIINEFHLPNFGAKGAPRWGFLNVVGDYLIGGGDPLFDAQLEKQARSPSKLLKLVENDNYSASRHLAVMDRHTGKLLWTTDAKLGFRHNGICAGNGTLFCIDRLSGGQSSRLKASDAEPPSPARVVAFDLATGKTKWESDANVFGTWLSYSEQYDVLVESGRVARDTLNDEPKGMRAFRGVSGKQLWFEPTFVGPAMLRGKMILRGQGACDLLTGKINLRRDPITGELEEWIWQRNYGCNTPAASEHLLTFRSGAAGFYDLSNDCGTGNFGGFRSSCTNNLIVAGGVLSAPDYTRTCTCSYQNQSSIAMVPMPDVEEWTFYGKGGLKAVVKNVGINFGAPGDRKDADGTLWLEYPSVAGTSPAVPVTLTGKTEYFRRHQSSADGKLPWVVSSGVKNLESLTMKLLPDGYPDLLYTVRLYFSEPDDVKAGDRVFDIAVQGKKEVTGFDIRKLAGARNRGIVREFKNVLVDEELRITFQSKTTLGAILCGIEVEVE